MPRTTLVKPPPVDPRKSPIENVLDLTTLVDIGPDIFTNTRPLWHPPGARGIYGGAVIAQTLAAAQHTIPSNFVIHSMHCYFVLAGDASIPILYHVERVREGKSFATRTVQARQRGRCIFTTTASFVREGSGGEKTVSHELALPEGALEALEREEGEKPSEEEGEQGNGPFVSMRLATTNNESRYPHMKKTRQWIKARGKISPQGGHQAHLSALAYMSDSYFIGTVSRVHNLWRFAAPQRGPSKGVSVDTKHLKEIAELEEQENRHMAGENRRQIGMMVSLDHTIFFHSPKDLRADEWMYTEMQSPWAGDGRGLVFQKIWSREGKLVASCVQEGLVRLKQDDENEAGKSKL